jgi:HD-GYP domain-containing protein (c-di-GMP phosphodiesterase class II)
MVLCALATAGASIGALLTRWPPALWLAAAFGIGTAALALTSPGQLPSTEEPHAPAPEQVPEPVELLMPPAPDAGSVVQTLLRNAEKVACPVAAHMWLSDPATSTLRLVSAAGPSRPDAQPLPYSSMLGEVVQANESRMREVREVAYGARRTVVWRLGIPLTAGDALGAAAIDVESESCPDAEALTRIASAMRGPLCAALGLHVAAMETQAAQVLLASVRELSRIVDAKEVVNAALECALELSGARTGSVMLLDAETEHLRIAASKGLSRSVVERTEVAQGEGIAGWVLASLQPVLVEDLDQRGPRSRRHGVRSALSVPIADADGVLGVLNVGNHDYAARFTKSHSKALEALAGATAVALRNARALDVAQDLYMDTLLALALALETKDPYARGGTQLTVDLASLLGCGMGLSEQEALTLRIAAMLHDVGMSAAGEAVAFESRPLTTIERGMIMMHPSLAADVLRQAPALKDVVPAVYHHHERFDGSGYAFGLVGEQIPLAARILAVVDSYVAMTSERPYRVAMSSAQAIAELKLQAGSQFDPEVVAIFAELAESSNFPASTQR